MQITLITVTYGRRAHLLGSTLLAAAHAGVTAAIVVNNGQHYDELSSSIINCPIPITTIEMGANTGSAGGFSAGMSAALSGNVGLVLVLDDDNLIQQAALASLTKEWSKLSDSVGKSNAVVLANRGDHPPRRATKGGKKGASPEDNGFFGFKIQDIPKKFLARILPNSIETEDSAGDSYDAVSAPYGGMFFHTDLLHKHGLPDKNYVLYVDDTDYSYRLVRGGATIKFIPSATVEDAEKSWNVKSKSGNSFMTILNSDSEFRVFYSSRNQSFFEHRKRSHNTVARQLNKFVYLSILYFLARIHNRLDRYYLFKESVNLGEQGILGPSDRFPLKLK